MLIIFVGRGRVEVSRDKTFKGITVYIKNRGAHWELKGTGRAGPNCLHMCGRGTIPGKEKVEALCNGQKKNYKFQN